MQFLKPSPLKILLALINPAIVGLLVTQRIENTVEFYGYLLTPLMAYYDGSGITHIFNRYFLLWIVFYLVACAMALLIRLVGSR